MADIEATKTTETTIEEKKAEEKAKIVVEEVKDDEAKVEENGDKAENGDAKEESAKETEDKEEETTDKCCIKRKSTGGDAVEDKEVEESTPEKKAKLDTAPAEAEANGEVTEAEVAA